MGGEISVGQRQRLVIAQGLLRQSRLFLFDEPTSALDAISATELIEMLKELSAQAAVIIVSHDANVISAAHRVISLS